jgi:prepilin-type N-terminal cleavage/methylation domain-containing protein
MRAPDRSRLAGFTLLECVVAAAVFALLVAAFAQRVLFYNAEAERVAVQQLTGALRTALHVRSAGQLANGNGAQLLALTQANPMDLLSEKPVNYLGEYYSPAIDELPRGNWFFDRSDRTLIYLPENRQNFSASTLNFLKFKVKFLRLPTPASADGRSKVDQGLILDQVTDEAAVNTY